MKKKRKVLIFAGSAAILLFAVYSFMPKSQPLNTVSTSPLSKMSLQSTVNATGTVQSTNVANVYAELNYPVESLPVKVGDQVKAGDILCVLKTDELQDSIEKEEADLYTATINSQQQLKSAQKKYDDEKFLVDSGLNSQINSAQDAVLTAQNNLESANRNLEKAQQQRDDAQKKLTDNLNAELIAAKAQLEQAKVTYERTSKEYRERNKDESDEYRDLKKKKSDQEDTIRSWERTVDNLKKQLDADPLNSSIREDYSQAVLSLNEAEEELKQIEAELDDYEGDDDYIDPDDPTRKSLKTLREAAEDAEREYATARKNLEALNASIEEQMTEYERAVTEAQATKDEAAANYESAVTAQKSTQATVQQGLEQSLLEIESTKYSGDNSAAQLSLQQKKDDLAMGIMRAPISGTVTAVYTTQGAPASGLMFIIEDTDSLEVVVRIKEYDVNTVKTGMPAVVKADAIDNQEFDGVLSEIAPTAIKNNPNLDSTDNSAKTGNIEFEAKVQVKTKETPLRIGMNGRTEIIVEQKDNVFAVPFEALASDEAGNPIIYTLKAQEDGTFLPEAIPVTLGLETDYEVEISGENLAEGMPIINDAGTVIPGLPVQEAGALGGDVV